MAAIKGVKEKVHLPLFDSVSVKPGKRLGDILTSNVMRFFQDVTGKTKLQTNMQASSLLPHWNTYEARALRVVISDLPAQFPNDVAIDVHLDRIDIAGPAWQQRYSSLKWEDSHYPTLPCSNAVSRSPEGRRIRLVTWLSWMILTSHTNEDEMNGHFAGDQPRNAETGSRAVSKRCPSRQ